MLLDRLVKVGDTVALGAYIDELYATLADLPTADGTPESLSERMSGWEGHHESVVTGPLLDLCALTDTLIADSDGVYPGQVQRPAAAGPEGHDERSGAAPDPLAPDRGAAAQGRRHKAECGELRHSLPVGFAAPSRTDPSGS